MKQTTIIRSILGNAAVAAMVLTGLVASGTAAATTWTTTGSSSISGSYGNSRSFTSSGVTLTATGWSNTGAGGAIQDAYLGAYGGGLGVTNRSEGNGGNNTHQVDNGGGHIDSVRLAFSAPTEVRLTDLLFGFSSTSDSDFTVLYSDTGTMSGTYGSLSGWNLLGAGNVNCNGAVSCSVNNPANGGIFASYWLVVANGAFGGTNDLRDDAFKLQTVTGVYRDRRKVPEPGTLALLSLGLMGLGAVRRRK
jgi:hypothetical protein